MDLFGTDNGHFFFVPSWVDLSLAPGHTSLSKIYGKDWTSDLISLRYFFFSPNLLWFSIALFIYLVFPYDLEKASSSSSSFFIDRLVLNLVVVVGFTGFWYVTLYVLGWGKRKYNPNYAPSKGRMVHNVLYTCAGTLQWTLWEVVFCKIYADRKLDFISDSEAFATWGNASRIIFWSLAIPLWREFHFYFSHRFIHIRVLYKYVHSLHHRNIDSDPFSGLCMHPLEHLYYFSCIAPSLFFYMSPFHFLWNGIHLLLSPAAGHSGWEDHWSSDQYHYLHHIKFECNFGTMGIPFDKWFGTYRDKIGDSSTNTNVSTTASTGAMLPSIDHIIFNLVFYVTCFFVGWRMISGDGNVLGGVSNEVYGWLLAVGQIGVGFLLKFLMKDKLSARWPFHKEVASTFGLHLVVGFLLTAVPVYYTVVTLLNEKV